MSTTLPKEMADAVKAKPYIGEQRSWVTRHPVYIWRLLRDYPPRWKN